MSLWPGLLLLVGAGEIEILELLGVHIWLQLLHVQCVESILAKAIGCAIGAHLGQV